MNIFDKPENIKNPDFLLAFFSFLFLVLTGIALFFTFERELFVSLDWVKLILISIAVILPLVFINIIISLILTSLSGKKSEDFFDFSLGVIIGGLSVYGALAINHFRPMSFGFTFIIALISDLLIGIWLILKAKKN